MTNSSKRALSFYDNQTDSSDNEQTVEGYFSTPHTKAWLRLDDRLEASQHSSKTYRAYLNKLDQLITKEPDYLDAYNYAGCAYLDMCAQQEFSEAIIGITLAQEYYSRAFERAKDLIPPGFAGQIIWGHLDNRPFLRAHHGLILCHLRKKEYAEAAKMIKEHLTWNPNDNIGVRYLLGGAYMLSGDMMNARRAFASEMNDDVEPYPDNVYSLGLLEFREGNYSAASTALRIGFVSNVYIAEILTGRSVDKPHFFWHGTSWASVRSAKNYLFDQDMMAFWKSTPLAIDFVDWLFNCATVLRERHQWTEIREGLTYEHDFAKRSIFCDRENALRKNITKVPMLIQKITDRRGESRWKWEHSRSDFLVEQV